MIKFLVLSGLSFFSPEIKKDSIGLETINGKVFIVHKVDAGETLYAISKRYGVTIEQIVTQNPSADAGLEVDQILKVPYVPRTARPVAQGKKHVVAEKETLFSISRVYGVTVDELKKWNCLVGDNLIVNTLLYVPPVLTSTVAGCTQGAVGWIKSYVVKSGDTMYAIATSYGTTQGLMKSVNCRSSDLIYVGELLWVPNVPTRTPFPTLKPGVTATPYPTDQLTETALPYTITVQPSDTPLPLTSTPVPTFSPQPTPTATLTAFP